MAPASRRTLRGAARSVPTHPDDEIRGLRPLTPDHDIRHFGGESGDRQREGDLPDTPVANHHHAGEAGDQYEGGQPREQRRRRGAHDMSHEQHWEGEYPPSSIPVRSRPGPAKGRMRPKKIHEEMRVR